MKIAFITDEVTQDFNKAIEFALENKLQALELRTIEDTQIDQIDINTLYKYNDMIKDAGLEVCCLSSSFYKCEYSRANIEKELEKLQRLCGVADILDCKYIRGFSFFFDENKPVNLDEIADKFIIPSTVLKQRNKIMLLEADPSVNTANHKFLAKLIKKINNENIRAIYDPGNSLYAPIGSEEEPYPEAYDFIKPYISHIHIKDAVKKSEVNCVKVGEGLVGYKNLLERLKEDEYKGYVSMEVHYRKGGKLSEEQMKKPGGSDFSLGGAGATLESIISLREIMQEVGL